MRSRAVIRPFSCCFSMALSPPPLRTCASSSLAWRARSRLWSRFFLNSRPWRISSVTPVGMTAKGCLLKGEEYSRVKCPNAKQF